MERQRQRTPVDPGPGTDSEDTLPPGGPAEGGALRAAQGWQAVAREAAGEGENDTDAEGELRRRAQRSGQ